MPRVLFLEDFDYKPKPQVTIAYRKGTEKLVKADCAAKAIAAGKAEEVPHQARRDNGE